MCWRRSLIALTVLTLAVAACAKDSVKQAECKQFQFEGGATTSIRSDAVKSLDAMFVLGGRQRLFSMELELPTKDPRDHVKAIHLSAFFRPLQLGAVECEDFDEIPTTRCYVNLPNASMQVSAVFDRNSQIDLPAAMLEVADQVERSVLNCD
jgi:hypothetical protein